MTPTRNQIAGGALAGAALIAALIAGLISVRAVTPTYFEVDSIPGYECQIGDPVLKLELLASPQLLAMANSDAGSDYAVALLCAPEVDGGEDVSHHPALNRLPDSTLYGTFDGGAQVRVWLQGDPDAPFDCACSTGADCEQQTWLEDGGTEWRDLPLHTSVHRTQLRGTGCFPRSCVVFSGNETWPTQCPADSE